MTRVFLIALLVSSISLLAAPEIIYTSLDAQIKAEHIDQKSIIILISKSKYTLDVTYKGKVLKTYRCVFGRNPIADKRYQGDKCTPEGVFHIRAQYPHQLWSKFIWIDYPTEESWDKFRKNSQAGLIPIGRPIGGDIGIHGVPPGKDYRVTQNINWTDGCISLLNDDVDELYRCVTVGTEIRISK
jgi:murein L,D-transpeptidase YafK